MPSLTGPFWKRMVTFCRSDQPNFINPKENNSHNHQRQKKLTTNKKKIPKSILRNGWKLDCRPEEKSNGNDDDIPISWHSTPTTTTIMTSSQQTIKITSKTLIRIDQFQFNFSTIQELSLIGHPVNRRFLKTLSICPS